jgi:hypothetical protein
VKRVKDRGIVHSSVRFVGLVGRSGQGNGGEDAVLAGALLDRRQHPLHLEAVVEGRLRVGAVRYRPQQVAGLVDEGVLVSQAVAGRPPGFQVGVGVLGDEDAAEARFGGVLGVVVELQLVEPFEVEGEGAERAVDLDPQRVLAPGSLRRRRARRTPGGRRTARRRRR